VAAGAGLRVPAGAGLLVGVEVPAVAFDPVANEVSPGDVSSGALEGDAPTPTQAAATSAVQAAVASIRAMTI
jgi:hypothetical protein